MGPARRLVVAPVLVALACGASPDPARAPVLTPEPAPAPAEPAAPAPVPEDTPATPARTFCRSVAHIGDSTSTGMMSPNYIRDPEGRLDRQYARVGVEHLELEVAGGRSMVEHRKTQKNGVQAATELRERGFAGCWVIALGTNDAANAAKDPSVPPAQRVARMMAVVGEEPVLWVDVATRASTGYWARSNMEWWNAELATALAGRPNARIYRWSEVVREEWFTTDGIHFTSAGYAARAAMIADALAAAFPEPAAGPQASGRAVAGAAR